MPFISDRDFIAQINEAVGKEITGQHEAMERGPAGMPHDQYCTAVGMVRGLRKVLEIADEIRKRNNKEDA